MRKSNARMKPERAFHTFIRSLGSLMHEVLSIPKVLSQLMLSVAFALMTFHKLSEAIMNVVVSPALADWAILDLIMIRIGFLIFEVAYAVAHMKHDMHSARAVLWMSLRLGKIEPRRLASKWRNVCIDGKHAARVAFRFVRRKLKAS